jgi:HEAT repeat protein
VTSELDPITNASRQMLRQLRDEIDALVRPGGQLDAGREFGIGIGIEISQRAADLLRVAGTSGEPALAEVLGLALRSPEPFVRTNACYALSAMGPAASGQAELLTGIVRGGTPWGRAGDPASVGAGQDAEHAELVRVAAFALAGIGSDDVAREILHDLSDEADPGRRRVLATALLGSPGLPEVRRLMEASLSGAEDLWDRNQLVHAIAERAPTDTWTFGVLDYIACNSANDTGARCAALDGLRRFLVEPGTSEALQHQVRELGRALRADADPSVSARAVAIEGELRIEDVVAIHRARLDHDIPIVQDGAAAALAEIGDRESVPLIATILRNRIVLGRHGGIFGPTCALRELAERGHDDGMVASLAEDLLTYVDSDQGAVATEAIEAVGLLGDMSQTHALHDLLTDPAQTLDVRVAAARALGHMREPGAADLLARTSQELYEAECSGDLNGLSFDEFLELQSVIHGVQNFEPEVRGRNPTSEVLAWLTNTHHNPFHRPPMPSSAVELRGDARQQALSAGFAILAEPRPKDSFSPQRALDMITAIGDDGAVLNLADVVADRRLSFDRRMRAHLAQRSVLERLDREVGRIPDLGPTGIAASDTPRSTRRRTRHVRQDTPATEMDAGAPEADRSTGQPETPGTIDENGPSGKAPEPPSRSWAPTGRHWRRRAPGRFLTPSARVDRDQPRSNVSMRSRTSVAS